MCRHVCRQLLVTRKNADMYIPTCTGLITTIAPKHLLSLAAQQRAMQRHDTGRDAEIIRCISDALILILIPYK
ncbi:unnamed protein product [Acanthocheilonema viteae]|uniref:Uncharacterized protein n=1 Tax=Acanthocheilonema viteae TaxID=6277 RepID=A0A498SDB8_ACAVI|nr:unnamed protein product [Acanthocheilonema viteae]